ncbi:MAG: phosphatase PAP2 family protein [Candidatus Electrothrix sp. AR4]|nr:phosphatase PAP2 family protein [Candidatus Electrothrix sp. AR4]
MLSCKEKQAVFSGVQCMKKSFIELAAVAAFLLLVTVIFWFTDADRFVTSLVPRDLSIAAVHPECDTAWPVGNLFPWNILYDIAPIPAVLIAGAALIILLTGFFKPNSAPWRKKAFFILLFLSLGPGLVVNVLLKDQLGRPRPREIIEFGGHHQFTQCWQPGTGGSNSSFPSGHAAIAFFSMAPWFIFREEKQTLAAVFLGTGLVFGSLVGIARVLQGGHFMSDVIWSGGLLYLLGSVLVLVMRLSESKTGDPEDYDITIYPS